MFGSVSFLWVNNQQFRDEILCCITHMIPLWRREIKFASENLTIHGNIIIRGKWWISTETINQENKWNSQNISDYTNGPDIDRWSIDLSFHNFWSQITRCSTRCRETIHCMSLSLTQSLDPNLSSKSKVSNLNIGIILLILQQNILRLQISVNDPSIMTISNCV